MVFDQLYSKRFKNVVAHAFNPSPLEVEIGRSLPDQGQPGLNSDLHMGLDYGDPVKTKQTKQNKKN